MIGVSFQIGCTGAGAYHSETDQKKTWKTGEFKLRPQEDAPPPAASKSTRTDPSGRTRPSCCPRGARSWWARKQMIPSHPTPMVRTALSNPTGFGWFESQLASDKKECRPALCKPMFKPPSLPNRTGTIMEVDGMAPWMTSFLYKQVVVHFHGSSKEWRTYSTPKSVRNRSKLGRTRSSYGSFWGP